MASQLESEEETETIAQAVELEVETEKTTIKTKDKGRTRFVNGLSVGVGIGCIATFVVLWTSIFYSSLLISSEATYTYGDLLQIFVYPLMYLLLIGAVFLTAGIVREQRKTT